MNPNLEAGENQYLEYIRYKVTNKKIYNNILDKSDFDIIKALKYFEVNTSNLSHDDLIDFRNICFGLSNYSLFDIMYMYNIDSKYAVDLYSLLSWNANYSYEYYKEFNNPNNDIFDIDLFEEEFFKRNLMCLKEKPLYKIDEVEEVNTLANYINPLKEKISNKIHYYKESIIDVFKSPITLVESLVDAIYPKKKVYVKSYR
ncbi:MAG: hypothetical protein IJ565_04815 [Bacilli bacterium]|nr:hypothetical protein [Bacilli bacterium]